MPGKPFRFVIAFEGTLDQVPGAWHSEADFQQLATQAFMAHTYANPSVTILESTDGYDTMGGWKSNAEGWIEVEGFDKPTNLDPFEEIQIKTAVHPYGFPEWHPAAVYWNPHRKHEADRITHYRKRKPKDDNPDADAGSHYAFCEPEPSLAERAYTEEGFQD